MPIQAPSVKHRERSTPRKGPLTPPKGGRVKELRSLLRELGVRNGFSDKRREEFYRELQLLVSAGVDPASVLDVLATSRPDDHTAGPISSLRRSIAQGRTLSGAMMDEAGFSRYEVQCIQVGEETGRLTDVLAELAGHYHAKVELRRTLTSAFAYPSFVLLVTSAVVAFMLKVVVPMFADVFGRSGAELPRITRVVMRASDLAGPVFSMLLLTLGVVLGTLAALRRDPRVQAGLSWFIVRLPLVGKIHRQAQFARLYRAMGSMLAAQLPLDRALALSSELVDLYHLRHAVSDIRERVMKGVSLHEACKAHPLFEVKDVAMIAVAEEVRQLDHMFARMADDKTAEVRHRTALLGNVLEPAMIVIIAVFVGTILVAMYLPMFKLSTAF